MSEVTTIKFEGATLSFMELDGGLWIPLQVACKHLGIASSVQIPTEDRMLSDVYTPSGVKQMVYISIGMFFELAITYSTPFYHWFTHVALPDIFCRGGYISEVATKEQVARLLKEYEATQNKTEKQTEAEGKIFLEAEE